MKRTSTAANATVFLAFFGIATLEAFTSRSWWWSAFWVAMGLLFIGANRLGRSSRRGVTR